MKAIIYAGITLFSVASVYGITDYYSSKNNGSLNGLYNEEVEKLEEAPKMEKPIITAYANEMKAVAFKNAMKESSIAAAEKKLKNKKLKRIDFDDFSRGRIVEMQPLPIEALEPLIPTPQKPVEANPVIDKPVQEQ